MNSILNSKYSLALQKPIKNVIVKPLRGIASGTCCPEQNNEPRGGIASGTCCQLKNYMINENSSKLQNKYLLANKAEDDNQFKKYTGGMKNTSNIKRQARQHLLEHTRKNLQHQAKLHKLRLASNPNFYQPENDKPNAETMEKIKNLFIKLNSMLKTNNYSKEVMTYIFDIQQLILDKSYDLTFDNIQDIFTYVSASSDLMDVDVVKASMDIKDRGVYETLADGIKNIKELVYTIEPYVEKSLRERKFAQKGLKINFQNKLLEYEKIFKDFEDIEEKLKDRLKYDKNYNEYLRQLRGEENLVDGAHLMSQSRANGVENVIDNAEEEDELDNDEHDEAEVFTGYEGPYEFGIYEHRGRNFRTINGLTRSQMLSVLETPELKAEFKEIYGYRLDQIRADNDDQMKALYAFTHDNDLIN